MSLIQKILLCVTIVGGVNWLLIGLFDFNLVSFIFRNAIICRIIYSIVGFCSLANLALLFIRNDHKLGEM